MNLKLFNKIAKIYLFKSQISLIHQKRKWSLKIVLSSITLIPLPAPVLNPDHGKI
jgi:hypothetical protein